MHSGFFITIEGIDGIGKSTQIKLLVDAIKSAGQAVYLTKEPGDKFTGSIIGAPIRHMLFTDPGTQALGPGIGDLLFLADHMQNVYEIKKYLETGVTVISDRYADSQFAYAASPTKKAPAWANKLFAEHYGVIPDLTLLMVARGPSALSDPFAAEDIGWALQRANARRGVEAGKQDGKAWNDIEAQRTIQNAYLTGLTGKARTAIINIWDSSSAETVHELIMAAILLAQSRHGEGKQPNLPLVELVAEAA
jgi:dTMP kinase